jgi:hypothetical protein
LFWNACVPAFREADLLQKLANAMADRYMYLPSLGVLVLGVWGACELTRSWRRQIVVLSAAGAGLIILCISFRKPFVSTRTASMPVETSLKH